MTDRDTFAAAALTGLIAGRYDATAATAKRAYDLADAMLRERSRAGKNASETVPKATKCTERETDHDAAPAAKAYAAGEPAPKCGGEAGLSPRDGTGDICERLRRWFKDVNAVSAIDLMDEAADEIDRLREAIRRLADQDATLSVSDGSVTVTMDATLTDEEREVLEEYLPTLDETARNLALMSEPYSAAAILYSKKADTLRNLLERLT